MSSSSTTAAVLFSLFLLSFFSFSAAITIPLSKSDSTIITPLSESSNPWQALNHLATSSVERAGRLKFPRQKNTSLTRTPMYPRSYGGYSISLSYGTPPQQMKFVMDTGSSLVWFPCTHRYACSNCSFPDVDSVKTGTFIPNMSNSSRILGCRNPRCGWLHKSNPKTRCKDCDPDSDFCNQACPADAETGIQVQSTELAEEEASAMDQTMQDEEDGLHELVKRWSRRAKARPKYLEHYDLTGKARRKK